MGAGQATATVRRRPTGPRLRFGRAASWLLLAPALVILVVLVLIPYGAALFYAFTDARFARATDFNLVGLDNFATILNARLPPFSTVLGTTLLFSLGTAVGSMVFGTTMAVLLHTLRPSRRGALLSVLLIPYVLAGVIVGYTWKLIYDPQIGLANTMLDGLGVPAVGWLTVRGLAIGALVAANVWAASGIVLLVVSSALTNLPRNIILAAQIDGARTFTLLRRIVLPNITPAILLAALIAVISGLNVFDLIFVLTHGGPVYQTETFALTMYRLTFRQGSVALGASYTLILFVLTFALAFVYLFLWQREARRWK